MSEHEWLKEFPGAVTVCDKDGILIEMNDAAEKVLEEDGGRALMGKNILDCHPEPARSQLKEMMEQARPNVYTIDKKGQKKLIYQTPWFKDGKYAGFVEVSLVIPFEMPNFVRS